MEAHPRPVHCVLQILLDAAVADDLGFVFACGRAHKALAAFEDQLDQVRAADVEVVGDESLEDQAGAPGCVKRLRVREVSTWRSDNAHQ